jgi:Domain of unknown function (DUF1937)
MNRVFWYMMSPYTNYSLGKERAVKDAAEHAHVLMRAGIHVFAPVPHSAVIHAVDPFAIGWMQWLDADLAILQGAIGGVRLELMGFENSEGMAIEERELRHLNRPVIGWSAWTPVPEELLLSNQVVSGIARQAL